MVLVKHGRYLLTGVLQNRIGTAGVGLGERRHVVHVPVERDPGLGGLSIKVEKQKGKEQKSFCRVSFFTAIEITRGLYILILGA